MFFAQIHQLLGAAPYEELDIISDIDLWVSDTIDGKEKRLDAESLKRGMDRAFSAWGPKKSGDCLSFKE